MMRRLAPIGLVLGLFGSACSQAPADRSLQRYYDPGGFFSAELPLANSLQMSQSGAELGTGYQLLAGVTSSPPDTSGSVAARPGFGAAPDQAIFLVWAIGSETISSSDDVSALLTADPSLDVQSQEPFRFSDGEGTLLSGEYAADQGTFGIAGGFLAVEGTGYAVIVEFPQGQWEQQQPDLEQILGSFRARTPLGLDTLDMGGA